MKRFIQILFILLSVSILTAGAGERIIPDKPKGIVYPNPTYNSFSIKNDKAVASITIFNIVGKEILTEKHISGEAHDVTFLKKGIYLIRMADEEEQVLNVVRMTKK